MKTPPHSRRFSRALFGLLTVLTTVSLAPLVAAPVGSDYMIGAQDVLAITVFAEPNLSGKYVVEPDGSFSFPLVGRVKAAGMSIREFEAALTVKLATGYFRNPHLMVAIEQYRSQRVFIVGEVRNAGTYALSGDMALIEALAKAGSTTSAAGDEVIVIRGKGAAAPVMPSERTADDVVHVSMKDLHSGTSGARSLTLSDGDTIYVPRPELAYVFGQVKNPGSYPLQADNTVLQILSLAGGVTQNGATNRVEVIRITGGVKKRIEVGLNEIVRPGDTIIVPERFF